MCTYHVSPESMTYAQQQKDWWELGFARALGLLVNKGGTLEKARVCGATVTEPAAGPEGLPAGLDP